MVLLLCCFGLVPLITVPSKNDSPGLILEAFFLQFVSPQIVIGSMMLAVHPVSFANKYTLYNATGAGLVLSETI